MYALPNTPYNYKISNNISLLFYKCHCLDLRFQTTPFRGWCRCSQILLTWNSTTWKTLQPKLHYLYSQFLRNMTNGWVTKQSDLSWPLSVSLAKASFPRLTHISYWPGGQPLESRRWRHGSRLLWWVVDDARRSAGGGSRLFSWFGNDARHSAGGMAATYLAGLGTMRGENISPILPYKSWVEETEDTTFPILFKETTS